MSEKRRDSKNRILRTGESQEADGRYKFRYIDANGKRKSVYSWRLVATDCVPAGKRDNAPLREQEKLIRLQQEDKKSYSSIHTIRGVVRPAFQMAVDDDLLRKNPFDFQLMTILVNDAVTREAITRKQES